MEEKESERVRRCLKQSGKSQAEVASILGISESKFSKSVNGLRRFSAVEYAELADLFGVSFYWLVTGEEDPRGHKLAARHDFHDDDKSYSLEGMEADKQLIEDIALIYRQAYASAEQDVPTPVRAFTTVDELRGLLPLDFATDMVRSVNSLPRIDVLVLDIVGPSYTLRVAGRYVIIVKRTARWFRQNFSIAHELGHIAADDFDDGEHCSKNGQERAANAFAAELLMPKRLLGAEDWQNMSEGELANLVWQYRVSTQALKVRLNSLKIATSSKVQASLELATFALLRKYLKKNGGSDPFSVASRYGSASERFIPTSLLEAVEAAVMKGDAPKESLAYLLDTSPDEIELFAMAEPDVEVELDILKGLFV
ncbi:MAG: XRE family transcriptional regulator [Actinomycetaceae bacterium]|nr:XRE family transcriptional regulator [Actinomycetaceae bacterium]